MATNEIVLELSTAANDVARNLPEAHRMTRWYRDPRFHAAAERVITVLYSIEVRLLSDELLAEVERLTRSAINLVEAHMLLRNTEADVADNGYCTDVINRLRDALDALASGLPADPAKRPSDEELLNELAADLRRVG
jgi:hypothetical protein